MERARPATRDQFWTHPYRPAPDPMTVITEALRDPDPYATAEQLARYHHDDVKDMPLKEIDRERGRLFFGWCFDLLTPWAQERRGVLDRAAEQRRRKANR